MSIFFASCTEINETQEENLEIQEIKLIDKKDVQSPGDRD